MADFQDKSIIVTGGAQGIGRGIVEYLLACGARVVIADIDPEAGRELVEYLEEPERVKFVRTDVADEQSVQDCVAQTVDFFHCLNGLVNNAGIANPGTTPIIELSLESWERILRTNLTGSFLMVKHSVPCLRKQGGAVVNIASTRALQSEPDTEAYSASKGGLVALTHALAVSLGSDIRVNAILPGWIDVSRFKKRSACYEAGLSEQDHRQHPAGRVGLPSDIAALAAFLLSDEAGFITGQKFVVDGGMTTRMIYAE